MTSNPHPEHGPLWVERNSRRCGYRPTAPEPAAAPFCTRCDGYGVVLPVGSSIAATCPACNGNTADRPERGPKAAPAAAPPAADLDRLAQIATWMRHGGQNSSAAAVAAAADELDAHRATHAELVELLSVIRAAEREGGRVHLSSGTLARILGEQP